MTASMPVAGRQRTRRKNAGRPLGRRALCWAAALFALSQAALALLVAGDGFAVRDPARRGRLEALRARIAAAPAPPRVVVLAGSSRIEIGLRALRIGREASEALGRSVVVTNQGVSGGGAFRSLLAVDRLLREGVVPDLLVLETFPALFSKTAVYDDATDVMLPPDRLDDADVELIQRYGSVRPDLGIVSRTGRWIPGYYHRAQLLTYRASWLLPPNLRWNASIERTPVEEVTWPEEAARPKVRAKLLALTREGYHSRLQNLSLGDPRQVGALGDLVGRVRARGTRVVFLATPEGPAFRSWYPPGGREGAADWLRGLAARHGVPLVDASGWTDDERLFFDSHHLTDEGAERFSRWLTREVLVPELRDGR